MKKIVIFLILILFICSCKNTNTSKKCGISRVISLAPAATEIIYALGCDKKLVAVTTDCNYPPSVKNRKKIGAFGYPDLEKIVNLKPDLVISTDFSGHPVIGHLKKLRINVINLENNNIENLLKNILTVGRYLNVSQKAYEVASQIKKEINEIKGKVAGKRAKVFIEIWGEPLFTAGGCSYIGELIELAGGKNITGYLKENYPKISEEIVLKENPDIIILTYKGRQKVLSRKRWKHIKAVKLIQVYDNFDFDIIQRPGPRVAKALNVISSVIKQSK